MVDLDAFQTVERVQLRDARLLHAPIELADGDRVAQLHLAVKHARDGDAAGPDHLADAVGLHQVHERLDLLLGAGDFDRQLLGPDVHDLAAEDLADLENLAALLRLDAHLHQGQVPLDRAEQPCLPVRDQLEVCSQHCPQPR